MRHRLLGSCLRGEIGWSSILPASALGDLTLEIYDNGAKIRVILLYDLKPKSVRTKA
jgi:hypothetical protein